ncbi:MAG: hypothetical protein QXF41_01735 [Candidatus Micrarchaeaceae archaeon]
MVKITYSPIEELVVHEIVKVDRDDLIRERVTPAGNMPLYWCNGILFSFSSLPMTDDIVRDYLKGKVHWLEVHFSEMEDYTPILSLNDEESKSTLNVRIINTSSSELHRKLVGMLKTHMR